MFDNYQVRGSFGPQYTSVTVDERRAPTDESVRLLREMEQKARDNILNTYVFDTNVLKGTVVQEFSPLDLKDKIVAIFDLNGETYKVESSIPRNSVISEYKAKLFLIEQLSKAISLELLRNTEDN